MFKMMKCFDTNELSRLLGEYQAGFDGARNDTWYEISMEPDEYLEGADLEALVNLQNKLRECGATDEDKSVMVYSCW